jgi:hypothetical protein
LKRVESDLVNVFARLKIIVAGIKMWPLLKMIRNKHGCLRAVLNQGKPGKLVRTDPAQCVQLPREKAGKPPLCSLNEKYAV